jgi:hypothetical protein
VLPIEIEGGLLKTQARGTSVTWHFRSIDSLDR